MDKHFRKLTLEKIEDYLTITSGILISILMLLTVIDVTGRYFFRSPVMGCVEISELLLVIIVMLSLSPTQRMNEHAGVDALMDIFRKMSIPLYPIFRTLSLAITEASMVFVAYYSLREFFKSYNIRDTSAGPLYLPVWPVRCLLCLGIVVLCTRLMIQIIEAAKAIHKWQPDKSMRIQE